MSLVTSLLCLVFIAWMVARIWKDNATLAILSVFLWPVMVFALLRYWNDEKSDIKVPFFLFVPAATYTYYEMHMLSDALRDQQQAMAGVSSLVG